MEPESYEQVRLLPAGNLELDLEQHLAPHASCGQSTLGI